MQQQQQHHWISFSVGRRCTECGLTQLRGEYDDSVACPKGQPAEDEPTGE
jgi:hypothetical protein